MTDVYIHTESYILLTTPMLSLPSYVEDSETQKPSALPSWVPDFTIPHITGRLRIADTVNIYESDIPLHRTYVSSSSLSEIRRVTKNILSVKGYCLGTVSGVATGDARSTPGKFDSRIRLLSGLPNIYLNDQSTIEVYWRTYKGDFAQSRLQNADHDDIPSSFIAMIIHGLLCWFDDRSAEDTREELEPVLLHLVNLDSKFPHYLRSLGITDLDLLIQDIPAFVSYCLNSNSRKISKCLYSKP
jgi:hypothetical protein